MEKSGQVRFAYGILSAVGHLIAHSLAVLSSLDNIPITIPSMLFIVPPSPPKLFCEWCDCTATVISIHPKEAKSNDLQPSLITLIGSSTFHCSFPGLDSTAGFDDFLE
jgi:hypothetical protein